MSFFVMSVIHCGPRWPCLLVSHREIYNSLELALVTVLIWSLKDSLVIMLLKKKKGGGKKQKERKKMKKKVWCF